MNTGVWHRGQIVLAACLLLAGCDKDNEDKERAIRPEGTWTITEAATIEGQPYQGAVEIARQGEAFHVQWETEAGSYPGIGLLRGSHLFVGWGNETAGVVIYQIGDDGTLEGQWTNFVANGIGTEQAQRTGDGSLEGTYQLTGRNADGTEYTGSLDIRRTGEVFHLAWGGKAGTATGVGIQIDKLLVVGYGVGGSGVIDWEFTEKNTATGRWTTEEADRIAVENLRRQ